MKSKHKSTPHSRTHRQTPPARPGLSLPKDYFFEVFDGSWPDGDNITFIKYGLTDCA